MHNPLSIPNCLQKYSSIKRLQALKSMNDKSTIKNKKIAESVFISVPLHYKVEHKAIALDTCSVKNEIYIDALHFMKI